MNATSILNYTGTTLIIHNLYNLPCLRQHICCTDLIDATIMITDFDEYSIDNKLYTSVIIDAPAQQDLTGKKIYLCYECLQSLLSQNR